MTINLKIESINLNLYTNFQNTLKTGMQVHELSKKANASLVLMGHSGIGHNAVFNDLFRLKINDEIKIIMDNYQYTYYLTDINSFRKGKRIKIINNSKYLFLITCDLFNMQKQWIFSSKLAKIEEI